MVSFLSSASVPCPSSINVERFCFGFSCGAPVPRMVGWQAPDIRSSCAQWLSVQFCLLRPSKGKSLWVSVLPLFEHLSDLFSSLSPAYPPWLGGWGEVGLKVASLCWAAKLLCTAVRC